MILMMGLPAISGDGGDRFRSAAVRFSFFDKKNKDLYEAGFNLFTGDPTDPENPTDPYPYDFKDNAYGGEKMTYSGVNANKYRLGAAYIGVNGHRFGANSELIRHQIQNRFAHDMGTKGQSKWFQVLNTKWEGYYHHGSRNPNSLW
jgi:hypothetical protein